MNAEEVRSLALQIGHRIARQIGSNWDEIAEVATRDPKGQSQAGVSISLTINTAGTGPHTVKTKIMPRALVDVSVIAPSDPGLEDPDRVVEREPDDPGEP